MKSRLVRTGKGKLSAVRTKSPGAHQIGPVRTGMFHDATLFHGNTIRRTIRHTCSRTANRTANRTSEQTDKQSRMQPAERFGNVVSRSGGLSLLFHCCHVSHETSFFLSSSLVAPTFPLLSFLTDGLADNEDVESGSQCDSRGVRKDSGLIRRGSAGPGGGDAPFFIAIR